jgi:hypothetical protein
MNEPRMIKASQFFAALVSAGIFHEDEANSTRRVVIDAEGGHLVKIYVERAGDDRLLNVTLTLDGIEVEHG